MHGRVSAIALRVRVMVKIGVRVYTTLTAMQSLHALGNLCVCVHMDVHVCIICVCMCACVFAFSVLFLYYIIYLTFHLIVAPPSIVRCHSHSQQDLEHLC